MASITFVHTRQLGTLVYGTFRDKAIGEALTEYPCNFSFDRYDSLPEDDELGWPAWYLPHSRRRRHNRYAIDTAAERLRELGHEVTVTIDDTTPAVGFAEFRQEKYDRADLRAAALAYRARRKDWESNAIQSANRSTYEQLNGQPILVGHHSERRHRNLLDRLWQREGKAIGLYRESQGLFARAAAAEIMQAAAEDPGTTQRRLKKIEAELRKLERDINACTNVHAIAIYRADLCETLEEHAYWTAVLEASGVKVWGPDDFAKGDFVLARFGVWHEIGRVNKTSISVAGRYTVGSKVVRLTDLENGRPVSVQPLPYDEVRGHLSAEEARERWPQLFVEDVEQKVPAKPGKKRGKTKLVHKTGLQGEHWYWTVEGTEYHAYWPHPEGWYGSTPRGELVDLPAVRVKSRPIPRGFTARYDTEIASLPVDGPVWWPEQVHNLMRAFVEARSYVRASADSEADQATA
ncbi:DUF3560 domain-containing protein [Nocardia sp. CA-120079]|uniref:DUF3560 domain-containing protein n=1 Tax=Nocardia sp. CA-120079 TaxID=3239974 RepID=UPI003D98FED4